MKTHCDDGKWPDLEVFQANFVFVTLIESTQEETLFRRRGALSPLRAQTCATP